MSPAGLPCSRLRQPALWQPALWQPASFPSRWAMLPTSTGQLSISAVSSPRPSSLHRWPTDCPCGPRHELWIFSSRGLFLLWTFATCHGWPWSSAPSHVALGQRIGRKRCGIKKCRLPPGHVSAMAGRWQEMQWGFTSGTLTLISRNKSWVLDQPLSGFERRRRVVFQGPH